MGYFIEKIKILSGVYPNISEASPQMIEWTGYKISDMNAKMYRKLSTDRRRKVVKTLAPGIHMYRLPDKFAVLDENKQSVLYLVQFLFHRVFGKNAVTQIKVWRNPSEALTKDLATRIFFTELFPLADCIVTDQLQTTYGKSFWELRIYEALDRGLPVYLLDHNVKTKQRLTVEQVQNIMLTWWGDEIKYRGKTIAICHKAYW